MGLNVLVKLWVVNFCLLSWLGVRFGCVVNFCWKLMLNWDMWNLLLRLFVFICIVVLDVLWLVIDRVMGGKDVFSG